VADRGLRPDGQPEKLSARIRKARAGDVPGILALMRPEGVTRRHDGVTDDSGPGVFATDGQAGSILRTPPKSPGNATE